MNGLARTLRLHCLRHDVVESNGRGSSTLLSGVLFALLSSSLIAGIAGRDAALLFALLGLVALVDAFGDVATAFLDPRDLPLLRTLPIAPGDYVRARLAALALPLVVRTLALGVPAIAATLARGDGVRAAAALLVALALMTTALSASAVLLLLFVRRVRPGWRLYAGLAWLRALLLVATTAGWLLLLRGEPGQPGDGAARVHFDAAALPSAWFAELFRSMAGAAAGATAGAAGATPIHSIRWGMVAAALGLVAAAGGGIAALASSYVALLEGLEPAPKPRARSLPAWRRFFEQRFVAPAERPTFRLGLALLRRERTFRLQTLPLLAYPLLFLALGRGQDDGGLFALLFAQLPAIVLALTTLFLRYSDSPAGGFALRFFGGGRAAALDAGARKALWYAVALPLALVVTAMLAWDRGLLFGLAVGAMGLLSSTVALLVVRSGRARLPFVERFRGRIDGGEGGSAFGLLLPAIVAAAIEWPLVRAGAAATGALAGAAVAAIVWLLRRPLGAVPEAVGLAGIEAMTDDPPVASAPVPPFPERLRRELRGLAVFFALGGVALTAFFAWI